MQETGFLTMAVFVLYILGVFALAAGSHRLLVKRSFVSEYFLGSRGLGAWTLAFTFAATSASGGSFGGFPSLIYSHGWVLALWIASYMVMPLTTMAILGKRINQVARKTNAITIPDVFRDRFESVGLGILSSCIIIFFTTCFLLAQFKLGAIIIEDTFNLSFAYSYEVSLVIFAVIVVVYTAYGGFRAVVWTDVLQGVVMGVGVVFLVPIVITRVGGLEHATEKLVAQPPTAIASLKGPGGANGTFNDLGFRSRGAPHPRELVYAHPRVADAPLAIARVPSASGGGDTFRVTLATDREARVVSTANDVRGAIEADPRWRSELEVVIPYKNDRVVEQDGKRVHKGATGVLWFPPGRDEYRFTFVRGDEFVFGPGRRNTGEPFHPLGMIVSFFFMWAIIGMGQPGMMVRLMAFRDSRSLKRAILLVTILYTLVYLPLVFVVMWCRTELPLLTPEDSDRAIVLIATRLVADMGLGYQVLGAVFVAAPFAAVMSTVDSFLLMISSSAVRDIYQRTLRPGVSDETVRRASYAITILVGVVVTVVATRPPDFLQTIIVFVGGGFAAAFLAPMFLGLFWKGMTRQGALAAMAGGLVIVLLLGSPIFFGGRRLDILGIDPMVWGLVGSAVLGIGVSRLSGPAPKHLVARYFSSERRSR